METDTQLFQASLAGDRRAFAGIVERYKALVCSVTYSATGDFGVSEDLAQETFLTAWSNLNSLRNASNLSAWLCGIARNISLRWHRKKQRDVLKDATPLRASAAHATDSPTPRQSAIDREQETLIWRAIEDIPQDYRIPLILYYREGKSVKLVAEAMNISTDAAKQRLHRGRGMLKEQMTALVEKSLARTRPGKEFTLGILAILPALPTAIPAGSAASAHGLGFVDKLIPFGGSSMVVKTAAAAVPLILVALVATFFTGNTAVDSAAVAPAAPEQHEAIPETAGDVPRARAVPAAAESSPEVEAVRAAVVTAPEAAPTRIALQPREVGKRGYPGTAFAESLLDTVAGTVFDPHGRPVEGARVWITRYGGGALDTRETQSDHEGKFALRVPDGQWQLRACEGIFGGDANTGFHGQIITEGIGKVYNAAIRMEPRTRTHGCAYDSESKKPIPFARFWTDSWLLVTADEEGRYEIEGQRRGRRCLYARSPGYENKTVLYTPTPGEETELDLFFKSGGVVVRGQVVDTQGHPLAHAWVNGGRIVEVCDEKRAVRTHWTKAGENRVYRRRAAPVCELMLGPQGNRRKNLRAAGDSSARKRRRCR